MLNCAVLSDLKELFVLSLQMQELHSGLEQKKENYIARNLQHNHAKQQNEDDISLSETDQGVLDSLKKDLAKKRDAQLKAEIRRLQTESVLAEKEHRARAAEERRRAEDSLRTEETQLKKKQV